MYGLHVRERILYIVARRWMLYHSLKRSRAPPNRISLASCQRGSLAHGRGGASASFAQEQNRVTTSSVSLRYAARPHRHGRQYYTENSGHLNAYPGPRQTKSERTETIKGRNMLRTLFCLNGAAEARSRRAFVRGRNRRADRAAKTERSVGDGGTCRNRAIPGPHET